MPLFSRRSLLRLTAALTCATRAIAGDAVTRIATIGAGNIGGTLGTVWAKAGFRVMISSRHPEELASLVAAGGPNLRAGTVGEAIAYGDILLLAVPYGAMPEIARQYGRHFPRKAAVIDATNPFPGRDGEVANEALRVGAGLHTASMLPGAKIVRAFNAIGAARLAHGGRAIDGTRIGIPMAGDDPSALGYASSLVEATGFEPVIVGNLDFGKHLRPGAPLAGERSAAEIRRIAAGLS